MRLVVLHLQSESRVLNAGAHLAFSFIHSGTGNLTLPRIKLILINDSHHHPDQKKIVLKQRLSPFVS